MTSKSNLAAFIIGAGARVGSNVAATLRENGYSVALGSRNPPPAEERKPGYLYVKVDASKRGEIETAFDFVVEKLGPVNVVIYNAASFEVPPIPQDILSLSVDVYYDSATLGIGAFLAAQKAIASFKHEIHRDHPKTFITTGNILPFKLYSKPDYFTLGAQKALEARFTATAAESYKADGIKFYFATLVSKEGGIPGDFAKSGPTHAKVYWDLISNKEQTNWDHRFTIDGEKYAHY